MRLLCVCVVLSVLGLLAQGCEADTSADPVRPAPRPELDASLCAALIPDRIFERLGWPADAAPAVVRRSTCRREGSDGAANVLRRPVAAVGGDDLPEKSRQAYDERCAELDGLPDPDNLEEKTGPGETVDWLGPDQPTCVVQEADRGWNTLLTLTPEQALIEVWIEVDRPTEPVAVRGALTDLARIAADRF